MAGLKKENLLIDTCSPTPAGTSDHSSILSESYTHVQNVTVVLFSTGIDNLAEISMALKNINDWRSLGLQLGLLYPTLKRIEEEQRGLIDKCKTEMLAAWLQQQDNVAVKGVPCCAVLKAALKKIGENQLASEINL